MSTKHGPFQRGKSGPDRSVPASFRIAALIWLAACICAPAGPSAQQPAEARPGIAPPAEFRAGAAFRVVTPEPLLPVSGGVGPSHPTTRKLGDLTVRALVLERGATRVAIVNGDFLGFPAALGDKVRARVRGIPPENVLIGVTHTHSAPDPYGFPDAQGRTAADLKYLDSVCHRMADAVEEALERARPAALRIATGEARGKIAYNAYAEALFDPRCSVIQVVGRDSPDSAEGGRAIATLVSYAVHPEVLGSGQGILSPDLVGPFYERIEAKGGGLGIFMNGAQGGMVTADCRGSDGGDVSTWAECVRIGELLADEALRIVRDAPIEEDPGLFCSSRTIRLPVTSDLMHQILKASPLGYGSPQYSTPDGSTVITRLNLVNLGGAQILTVPGEALPNLGCYLKRKMRGRHNLLFGLTNDAFGYILAKEDWGSFRRYDYISRTSLGEMTGAVYVKEALRLVEGSPQP